MPPLGHAHGQRQLGSGRSRVGRHADDSRCRTFTPIDYFNDADFVLQSDGRITNKAETTTYCNAGSNQNACRNVTPPGGTAAFGWTFSGGELGPLAEQRQLGDLLRRRPTCESPATRAALRRPILLTIIAEGNIQISGNPDLRPEPASVLQFVTDKDLSIHGNLGIPLAFEGRILVREQIDFAGNPTLAGQVIVQNVPTVSTLVTNNVVTGSVTLSYNGSDRNGGLHRVRLAGDAVMSRHAFLAIGARWSRLAIAPVASAQSLGDSRAEGGRATGHRADGGQRLHQRQPDARLHEAARAGAGTATCGRRVRQRCQQDACCHRYHRR